MDRRAVLAAGLGLAVLPTSGAWAQAGGALPGAAQLEQALSASGRGAAVWIAGAGVAEPYGAAAGLADVQAGRPMTVDTPLRIASNAKIFTAATVLRLWEQGRIDLDAPIGPLISPDLGALLRADGYDTSAITVRHLLSHSGGLYDHGSDPRFIQAVLADPQHHWTRAELLGLMVEYADPPTPPGVRWRYSDGGYILLGDIIERITGLNLGQAVRRELRFDRLGLDGSWWEVMEGQPATAQDRAPQALGSIDARDIHASMDLYGGGGLVMSAKDLATFFAALWEGRVFDRPETLQEMLWQGSHERADHYRLGVFVAERDGRRWYWHSGFWGTFVAYSPDLRVAMSGVTVNQDAFIRTKTLVEQALGGPPMNP
ncbi:serine hydrolase domain-containing protein [Brevundimonas sp. 2R-24]|uniref:Serine hydrolase domain-containing protein n=1 Tax=Peiella sedimenti TaxID=3061083 RepID=A0ABT8SQD8_9CAUL|nr:serine hydrolase domain-containing protein [Caulobacteraceae bacterium XZ-24]